MGLAEHLSGTPAVERADAMDWMVSEPGRAFVRASSTAWADAAIAAGIPEAEARAADARTTAACTEPSTPWTHAGSARLASAASAPPSRLI